MARDHLYRAVCGVGFLANISIFAAKTALHPIPIPKRRASTRINPRFPRVSPVAFLKVWQPKKIWTSASLQGRVDNSRDDIEPLQEAPGAATGRSGGATRGNAKPAARMRHSRADIIRAWTPWAILTVFVFVWGLPPVKAALNSIFAPNFPIAGLHKLVEKMPPVVRAPTREAAIYTLNLLSATGTGILLSAIVGGLVTLQAYV